MKKTTTRKTINQTTTKNKNNWGRKGIWRRTTLIVREETRCRHMGYSFRLTARVILYAPSYRQDSTYHGVCYTSRGALAATRNNNWGRQLKYNTIQWATLL